MPSEGYVPSTYAVPCIRVPDGERVPGYLPRFRQKPMKAPSGFFGANLVVGCPIPSTRLRARKYPSRCSGFGLFISVSLQAYLKQVQLFFLILQPGVKGLALFGLQHFEDHACDRPAFFDHFHPDTEPGPGRIVIDLPDRRFQDIAAANLATAGACLQGP